MAPIHVPALATVTLMGGSSAAPPGWFTGGVDSDAFASAWANLCGVTAMVFVLVVGGFRCRRPLLPLYFSDGFACLRLL